MAELAGAAALEEIILERRLARSLGDAGLTVTPEDIEREDALLVAGLDDDPDVSARLLDTLRTRQGLGPVRYESTLYQNAALRALVASRIDVTVADITLERALRYGPRKQARLILVPTLAEAEDLFDALAAGADFATLATEHSGDMSAARGGLLEPISTSDPAYPGALRETLASLELGEVSSTILLDSQYAVLKLVAETPAADVDDEAIALELAHEARLRKERIAMDALAVSLLRNMEVVVFDDSLHDAWQRRRRSRP